MDDSRDAGIIVLALVLAICLTIFFLGVTQPTGRVVEFLFPTLSL